MDKEAIIKSACAQAQIAFQNSVEEIEPKVDDFRWFARRIQAIEKSLPTMLETALRIVLDEIEKDR